MHFLKQNENLMHNVSSGSEDSMHNARKVDVIYKTVHKQCVSCITKYCTHFAERNITVFIHVIPITELRATIKKVNSSFLL